VPGDVLWRVVGRGQIRDVEEAGWNEPDLHLDPTFVDTCSIGAMMLASYARSFVTRKTCAWLRARAGSSESSPGRHVEQPLANNVTQSSGTSVLTNFTGRVMGRR
jgi:hypothetical protein